MMESIQTTLNGGMERAVAYLRGDRGLLGALRQDHARIITLLDQVARNLDDPSVSQPLLAQALQELRVHCLAEEEVLYAWRKRSRSDENPLRQSELEHQEVLNLGDELGRIAVHDSRWPGVFETLQRLVALHFQDEEDQLFAAGRRELGQTDRRIMGDRYTRLRDEVAGRSAGAETP